MDAKELIGAGTGSSVGKNKYYHHVTFGDTWHFFILIIKIISLISVLDIIRLVVRAL